MRNHYSNFIQQITDQDENLSLSKISNVDYISLAFAKSKAECGNSQLYQANTSTPFYYRAFFVRSLRISKECYNLARSSMMAFSGQGLTLDCLPDIAVFHPAKRYRPTVESTAVALINLYQELSAMIYTYLCVDRHANTYQETKLRIEADTEQNARFQISARYRLVLPRPIQRFAKNQPNLTGCNAKGGVYVA